MDDDIFSNLTGGFSSNTSSSQPQSQPVQHDIMGGFSFDSNPQPQPQTKKTTN